MILAGLSWTAWLLLVCSVGVGLLIVMLFFLSHREDRRDFKG